MEIQNTEASQKPEDEVIDRALAIIGEHYENVQIIATRYDGKTGFSDGVSRGCGNWHARYGSVKNWIIRVEEESRLDVRKGES